LKGFMKIGLAVGGYPPDLDGIGDYTYWLARALADRVDVSKPVDVYTRTGDHTAADGIRIRPFFDPSRQGSFRTLLPLIREDHPDWLVLQYNPFCWGVRGWCPAVPWTLRKLKATPRAPKVAVMFHETTVPRWPWRFALMYAWQRSILRCVARSADTIFVSTKRWIPELITAGAKAHMAVIPAGSNVPRSAMSKAEARMRLGIDADRLVLAVFGGAHPSRQLDWIAEAARAVHHATGKVLLLHVGPEGELIAKCVGETPFMSLGIRSAKEVSDALRAADCLLSPFSDGISTRRTSAIAALNNGVPVATTRKCWTDDWFVSVGERIVLAREFTNRREFARAVVSWVHPLLYDHSQSVLSSHDRLFSWSQISAGMCERLATI
jgi:glycosyltransferase involved in cell wall biosynthesis